MSIHVPDDFDDILFCVSNARKRYPEACSKYHEKILKLERKVLVESEVTIPQSKEVIKNNEFTVTEKTIIKRLAVPMLPKQNKIALQLRRRKIIEVMEQLKNQSNSSLVSYLKKASRITSNSNNKITAK